MKERRLGRFSYPAELLEDHPPQELIDVMGKCVIVRAEHMYDTNQIEIVAYSAQFDIIPEGCVIPRYQWEFTATTVRAVRQP